MKRRAFIALIGSVGATSVWSSITAAAEIPRIGIIGVGSGQASRELVDAFRAGLGALGWTDGANLTISQHWAEDRPERLPAIVKGLVGSGVDVLVTLGTLATQAAAMETASIPIVFVGVADPLRIGVAESLDHPGGNASGLSLSSSEVIAKRLQLLKELLPNLRRLAVIIRRDPSLEQTLLDIRTNADRMGLELFTFGVTTGSTVKLAFAYLQNDRCEAIYLASGPLGPAKRADIIRFAAQTRLPAIYSYAVFASGGGLMSFAPEDRDLFNRASTFVDRILKGAHPADLPVEPPAKFNLAINLKTAKSLGLTVPQSLLSRADEVIE